MAPGPLLCAFALSIAMTRRSGARQGGYSSRDGTERVVQSSGTSSETEARDPCSGQSPNSSGALVASNLQKLPTWIPISDYLLRSDDPFPYGKMTHRS
ncbi:hypothetical protein F5Y01DRAFT_285742 [Xylaria sp. FL0043]|nr:hypothetical protein F5Y01DRAFT_285742 [Xylaria sp. FL0043]